MSRPPQIRRILLIEDDDGDVLMVRRFLKKLPQDIELVHRDTGQGGLDWLSENFEQSPVDLVLLDLNLPGLSGRDVLSLLRKHPTYHYLPVVVLSTSKDDRDIYDCYRLGANSYITKAFNPATMQKHFETLTRFWFEVVELPTPSLNRPGWNLP